MTTPQNANYLLNIKTILQAPIVKQLIFMLGIAGGVTLGIVLYMSIQEPIYRPLDYQVTSQNMASIIDALEKAGIRYKINEPDGIILIPAKDIQQARLKLSAAGVPKDDGFSFSFLNEQGGIGSSQFIENARYLRALENDLSKTISAIDGIAGAKVHIAIPQNNVFADENGKPTASVVINTMPGMVSDKEKVRAIVQIIASSVPGLDPKNVAITDQYGHYLSNASSQDSLYNAEQLSYQNNIQNYYEKRIESMIVPLIGSNKINVRVYADIDYTLQEETNEQFDPDKKVIRSEQSVVSEQGSGGGASGAPGSLSNTPPSSDSEKQNTSSNTQSNNSQGKSESTKNYEISKSVTYKKSGYPKVKSLSVAVVVDNEMQYDQKTKKYITKPVDKVKIEKITELVKATIGFDEQRGDRVTVVNSLFNMDNKNEMVVKAEPIWEKPWFWDMTKKTLGMILGFIFLFILYRRLTGFAKSTPVQSAPIKLIDYQENEDETVISPELQGLKQDKLNKLKELANREPHKVATVIRNWVGK